MEARNSDSPPPDIRRRRWQFGLPALLGTMMLLCLPFALWGAVLRANQADQFWLMLLCVITPLGVLVLASITVSVGSTLRNWCCKSAPAHPDDED
jgi:hypothetical protein